MNFNLQILCAALLAGAAAQQYTTPVPILKQINKYNDDGSYSYGYEAADGTYKIESKYPNGEVFGKYGYYDDQGQLREIEYGASRRGFEPAGSEVNVAPPTLTNNYPAKPLGPNEEDDGQYREDPSVYYKNDPYNSDPPQQQQQSYQQPSFSSRFSQASYQPPSQQQSYQQSSFQQQSYQQPSYRPQTQLSSFSQPRYNNPAPPAFPNYNQFNGHPASNVDIFSGSYSVNYKKR